METFTNSTGQSNRPRFRSAPSEAGPIPWPPRLRASFWSYLEEGGKYVHESIKYAVAICAPSQWESVILEKIDHLSQHVGNTLNHETRSRITDFYSSTISRIESSLKWSENTLVILITALLIIISIPLQVVLINFALGFALPFYAIFVCVNWFVAWRRENRQCDNQPSLKALNYWWSGAIVIDFILVILYMTISLDEVLATALNYALPVIAFVIAKLYLDKVKCEVDVLSWLLEYFFLCYVTRYFSICGFTSLPNHLRPFAGYLASYLAVVAAHKTHSKLPPFMDSGANGSTATSTADSCQPLSPGRPASAPQLVLLTSSAFRSRFHVSDSEPTMRPMVPAGRTSRRVSLPAGSLIPVKAQSNLSEARGMLADMLAQKDLPAHLVAGLKAVSGLLAPGSSHVNLGSQFDFLGTIPRVIDSPYIGGDVSMASVECAAQRRQSPAVVWSTTTSATGLPTLEPEPCRARSSSYWKQRHLSESDDGKKQSLKQSIDLPSKLLQLHDGTVCDLAEISRDPYLARLKEWTLPIFEFYAYSPDTILSKVAYTIFQRSGLFRIFKINKQKFMSFFHALEKGYWDIPYHNRIHATDVLHATYYFTSNKVPAFASAGIRKTRFGLGSIGEQCEETENVEKESDDEEHSHSTNPSSPIDDQSETLSSVLSSLELLGLYIAAAMHDFDHPGRTNAFLVAIQDPKAILYNDRSVLENHHAASAWQLLAKPENNFIEQLDPAEYKRLRYIVIESILATDLKRHFEILMDFNGKVGKGLDWDTEADKFLTSQMCIKMADINSPTKPGPLHKEWTDRILEEFYAQGDEEKARGLPVSPYMDRHDSQLARLQDSFIAHLVAPLAMAMNDAGLLPLTAPDTANGGKGDGAKSELLVNLEINHKVWKVELGEDPASAVQAVPHVPAGRTSSPARNEDEDMSIIEEQEDESFTNDD